MSTAKLAQRLKVGGGNPLSNNSFQRCCQILDYLIAVHSSGFEGITEDAIVNHFLSATKSIGKLDEKTARAPNVARRHLLRRQVTGALAELARLEAVEQRPDGTFVPHGDLESDIGGGGERSRPPSGDGGSSDGESESGMLQLIGHPVLLCYDPEAFDQVLLELLGPNDGN